MEKRDDRAGDLQSEIAAQEQLVDRVRKKRKFFGPRSFSTSAEVTAGPAPKVKKTAAPNQVAALRMPMKRRSPVTRRPDQRMLAANSANSDRSPF